MLGFKQRPQILLALILIAWLFAGGRGAAAETITIQLPGMDTALEYEAPSSDQLPTNLEPATDYYQVINPGAAAGCTSSDIEIVGVQGHPDNILEQWADPEKYGRYVLPDEEFVYKFNHPVNARLLRDHPNAKAVFRAEVPRVNDEWVDCNDPAAKGATTAIHKIEVGADDIRNMMGFLNRLLIRHKEPFYHGCRYGLVLPVFTVVNDSDQCFSGKGYPFTIAPNDQPHIAHESKNSYYDPGSGLVRSFEIKEPVQIKAEEMWVRYKRQLGLGDWRDEMVLLEGYPQAASTGQQISRYEQQFKHVPVIGGNFLIHEQDGLVQWATGQIIPDIDVSVKAELTKEEALQYALLAIQGQPEIEPTGRRVITSEGMTMEPDSWRLAWRFVIRTQDPFDQRIVDVDARDLNGGILNNYSTLMHALSKEQRLKLTDYPSESRDCTLDTRFEESHDASEANSLCSVYTIDSNDYWFLVNQVPRFEVLEWPSRIEPPLYIYDPDGNGIFEGDETNGASLYWGVARAIDYIRDFALAGTETTRIDTSKWWADLLAETRPLHALITTDSSILGQSDAIGLYRPSQEPTVPPQMVFLADTSDGRSGVETATVAHEFAHHLALNNKPILQGAWSSTQESAAVFEGLAETFGIMVKNHSAVASANADWCLETISGGVECARNIAHPGGSLNPHPSTLGGDLYKANEAACEGRDTTCKAHEQGIVAAHAFYLMAEGGSGTNSLGCQYEVAPFDANDSQRSRDIVSAILLITMRDFLKPIMNFRDLMIATVQATLRLTGGTTATLTSDDLPDEIQSVYDAWQAVGVHHAERGFYSEPYLGEQDVYPWQMQINFDVSLEDAKKTWEIQIATDDAFTQNVQIKDTVLRTTANYDSPFGELDETLAGEMIVAKDGQLRNLMGADFVLKQSTRYYWRYREKSSATWGNCYPVQFFDTGVVQVKIISPDHSLTSAAGEDFLKTTLTWKPAAGASHYVLRLSKQPEWGCADAAHVNTDELVAEVPHDDIVDFIWHQFSLLHPDTEYFWWVYAIGPDDEKGYCAPHGFATFRTKSAPLPWPIAPIDVKISYNSDVTFKWRYDDVYQAYRLQVWPHDQPNDIIYSKRFLSQDIVQGDEAVVANVSTIATTPNAYCWSVKGFLTAGAYDSEAPQGPESAPFCFNVPLPSVKFTYPVWGTTFQTTDPIEMQWKLGYSKIGYYLTIKYHREGSDFWHSDKEGYLFKNKIIPWNTVGWRLTDLKPGDRFTVDIRAAGVFTDQDPPRDIGFFQIAKDIKEEEEATETTSTSEAADPCADLEPPTNLNPPWNGTYSNPYPGSLSWSPVENATAYEVKVLRYDPVFDYGNTMISVVFEDLEVQGTSISPPLVIGTFFRWFVLAKNNCHATVPVYGTFSR